MLAPGTYGLVSGSLFILCLFRRIYWGAIGVLAVLFVNICNTLFALIIIAWSVVEYPVRRCFEKTYIEKSHNVTKLSNNYLGQS